MVGWFSVLPSQVGEYNTGQVQTRGAQGSYLAGAAWHICVTAQGGPGANRQKGTHKHTMRHCNYLLPSSAAAWGSAAPRYWRMDPYAQGAGRRTPPRGCNTQGPSAGP